MSKEITTFADLDRIILKAKEENKQGLRKAAMIVKSGARQIEEKQLRTEAIRTMIKTRIETENLYEEEMRKAKLNRLADEAALVASGLSELDELLVIVVE